MPEAERLILFLSFDRQLFGRHDAIVVYPVFARVHDNGRIGFADLNAIQREPELRDFREQHVRQILDGGRHGESLHAKFLARSTFVFAESFVQRIVDVDQHSVIVILFYQWLDLRIEVTEQSRDGTFAFYLEMANQTVAMTVQVAALVFQLFVAMCRVEFVLFANNHLVTISVKTVWRNNAPFACMSDRNPKRERG